MPCTVRWQPYRWGGKFLFNCIASSSGWGMIGRDLQLGHELLQARNVVGSDSKGIIPSRGLFLVQLIINPADGTGLSYEPIMPLRQLIWLTSQLTSRLTFAADLGLPRLSPKPYRAARSFSAECRGRYRQDSSTRFPSWAKSLFAARRLPGASG